MPRTNPGRWLKHNGDGTIYAHSDLLAQNPMVREVTPEEAFPEKHIPEGRAGRAPQVVVDVPDEQRPPIPPEIAADASRGLSAAAGPKAGLKSK